LQATSRQLGRSITTTPTSEQEPLFQPPFNDTTSL
jgi:hypothetical protein